LELSAEAVAEKMAENQRLLEQNEARETARKLLMLTSDLRKILAHREAESKKAEGSVDFAREQGLDRETFESDLGAGIFHRPLKKKRVSKKGKK